MQKMQKERKEKISLPPDLARGHSQSAMAGAQPGWRRGARGASGAGPRSDAARGAGARVAAPGGRAAHSLA